LKLVESTHTAVPMTRKFEDFMLKLEAGSRRLQYSS
jgi:hypothetical protein